MNGEKTQLESSTIIFAIVAIVGALLNIFSGYAIDEQSAQEIAQRITALVSALGAAGAWRGRIKADTQIVKRKNN